MHRHFLSLLIALGSTLMAHAQSTNIPLDPDYYHLIQRYEIKSGHFASDFHSNIKPYRRSDVAQFVDTLYITDRPKSKVDQFNLQYLANDNWEWSKQSQNASNVQCTVQKQIRLFSC